MNEATIVTHQNHPLMTITRFNQHCLLPASVFFVAAVTLSLSVSPVIAQLDFSDLYAEQPGEEEMSEDGSEGAEIDEFDPRDFGFFSDLSDEPAIDSVRFAFSGTSWREVINWIADEANLALHVTDLPTGTFTYSDPSEFTHQEAIDRINLFLLPQGFSLIRNGQLLSLINLGDPRSAQQIDAIANLVTVDQLETLGSHEVVKCIFALGELDAQEAVQELSALQLMTTPSVFVKTNQLMITDTAGKLRNVKAILNAFEPAPPDDGMVVKNFPLQHVAAEDILVVARPHLGLATGEMIGLDISISADLQGKNIFVTGVEDRVKLLEDLVNAIDQPSMRASSEEGESELRSHLVEGGNVETVYNVLQTTLAGKSVRLSMDKTAGSIVAFASPAVQTEIADTVALLQASEADFEVIPLKVVDPYFAISLLEEMLDLGGGLEDDEDRDLTKPKIDADPGNMRLFVRAKRHQIEQIKKIITGLDNDGSISEGNDIRLLPLKGKQAEQALETAVTFWRGANSIYLYRPTQDTSAPSTERVVNELAAGPAKTAEQSIALSEVGPRVLANGTSDDAVAIRCQLTPRGLLLQCDDTDSLEQFEASLRIVAGPVDSTPSPPIVFYLQFTKAGDAVRMLAELLDGGESALENAGSTLVNGYVSSSSSNSFLSSIVTSREGTITMMSGSITVVADTRLNRLIAQGTAADIDRIEAYLKIIDKDRSITSIETYGTSHVIELLHTDAKEVAAAVREAFAGRVEAANATGQARPGGTPGQPQRDDASASRTSSNDGERDSRNTGRPQPSAPDRNLEPKMTVAVHEPSNSLIITAPRQLYEEVERLVKEIDARGEQAVEVVVPSSGAAFEAVLQQVLLGTGGGTSRTRSTTRPATNSSSSDRYRSGR